MNLTLHHFRKEFRYLRWRWFGFLALLGFDLAVNLEWLFPLRMGDGPLELLSLLPFAWAIFAAGVLSGCPEDCPADERHFSGTRPVAMWHFWAVRVVVFVLLVLLPVVAQNAAYQALSGFVTSSVRRGHKYLLIITGKGSFRALRDGRMFETPTGVLRDQLPKWLAAPGLRRHIQAIQPAARHHGGDGAFYVLLRRARKAVE